MWEIMEMVYLCNNYLISCGKWVKETILINMVKLKLKMCRWNHGNTYNSFWDKGNVSYFSFCGRMLAIHEANWLNETSADDCQPGQCLWNGTNLQLMLMWLGRYCPKTVCGYEYYHSNANEKQGKLTNIEIFCTWQFMRKRVDALLWHIFLPEEWVVHYC